MAWSLEVESKLRPCEAYLGNDGIRNGLFHCWSGDKGIVELEDGKVVEISPVNIKFLDHPFMDYNWDRKENSYETS